MVSKLPDAFHDRMRHMLGYESNAFFDSLNNDSNKGLRVNTLKITSDIFLLQAPWNMEPVPWVENAFFCPEGENPASHIFYKAGLYYLQEPSAMTPADRLPVEPGEKVLDLCAAPGGKATALAAKLQGRGLIVANEVNAARAKALLYNMEVFGVTNALITNERADVLEKRFPEFFDKILVDAPCSGEGMFRKEEKAVSTWSEEKVRKCAAIQEGLLRNAVRMLRPGGMLMYSTCTFSKEENEENVSRLLEGFPEMKLVRIKGYEGFSEGFPVGGPYDQELKKTVRIWPHRMRGEGHFLALFEKEPDGAGIGSPEKRLTLKKPGKEESRLIGLFLSDAGIRCDPGRIEVRGERAFYMPELPEAARGLKILRSGLYLGDLKKNRFEPSQAFALSLDESGYRYCVDLAGDGQRSAAFLRGENIRAAEADSFPEKTWILVTAGGHGLSWCKKNKEILKNKYLCRIR